MQTRPFNLTLVDCESIANSEQHCIELFERYDDARQLNRIDWSTNLRLLRTIGQGGQGTVFLAERTGSDGFNLPVAVKIFSPEPYATPDDYDQDMLRVGHVAAKVARLESENLLKVLHFLNRDRIRIMIMEWIDGFDLRRLLTPRMLGVVQDRVSEKRWNYIQEKIVSIGKIQPRLNTTHAMHVLRDCLVAIEKLHDAEIVHGDIKPANIMINRDGKAKLIDVGTASDEEFPARSRACTPTYCSPNVLQGSAPSFASDLVSLGYVLLEIVSGQPIFSQSNDLDRLIQEKLEIHKFLGTIIPHDTPDSDLLQKIVGALIASESSRHEQSQFVTASDIIKRIDDGKMTADRNELAIWIEELLELPSSE